MIDINVTSIDINGTDYILDDTIKDDKNIYSFFSNPNDKDDIYVLKDKNEDRI